jgi:Glycosyl transferase family 11
LIGARVIRKNMIGYSSHLTGRLGNQLFQMNLLFQLGASLGVSTYSRPWAYSKLFEKFENHSFKRVPILEINGKKALPISQSNIDWDIFGELVSEIKSTKRRFNLPTGILGEAFFGVTKIDPRKFFHKNGYSEKNPIQDSAKVGIHFRGKDFALWNPNAIIHSDFYLDSINFMLNIYDEIQVIVFTDDVQLPSYLKVSQILLKEKKVHVEFAAGDLFTDFWTLANCKYIISSPSTFAIWASLLGVDKSIVFHSRDWIINRKFEGDEFWVNLVSSRNNLIPISLV